MNVYFKDGPPRKVVFGSRLSGVDDRPIAVTIEPKELRDWLPGHDFASLNSYLTYLVNATRREKKQTLQKRTGL